MKNKKPIYTGMPLSSKLDAHLKEIDRSAAEMLSQLVESMAAREGITEALKAEDRMEWVRRMNALRSAAEEVVLKALIYC